MKLSSLNTEVAVQESQNTLYNLVLDKIHEIVKVCNLDPEKMEASIGSTDSSEYGHLFSLVNLLVSKAIFPADKGDYASINENKAEVRKIVDMNLLLEIKETRGHGAFCTAEGQYIAPVAPDFVQYPKKVGVLLINLANEAGVELDENTEINFRLDESKWNQIQNSKIKAAKEEEALIKSAIEANKQLMQELGEE